MILKRTRDEMEKQIKQAAADYLRDPSFRTLGYLQLLIEVHNSMFDKGKTITAVANYRIVRLEVSRGQMDALEWLVGGS